MEGTGCTDVVLGCKVPNLQAGTLSCLGGRSPQENTHCRHECVRMEPWLRSLVPRGNGQCKCVCRMVGFLELLPPLPTKPTPTCYPHLFSGLCCPGLTIETRLISQQLLGVQLSLCDLTFPSIGSRLWPLLLLKSIHLVSHSHLHDGSLMHISSFVRKNSMTQDHRFLHQLEQTENNLVCSFSTPPVSIFAFALSSG